MKRKRFFSGIAIFLAALLIVSLFSASGILSAEEVPDSLVDRLRGSNRYRTAVAISQEGWEK